MGDRQRSHWMALLGSALGVGCVVGPFVGGYTAEAIGEASPAIIATVIFICLGPLIFALLPETVQDQTKTAGEHTRRAKRGSLWLDARLLSVLGVLALGELKDDRDRRCKKVWCGRTLPLLYFVERKILPLLTCDSMNCPRSSCAC